MGSLAMGDPALPRARSYQLEMYEASLKGNIIVAMGTGSGKTHIAILRIRHELEHSDGSKLIWFLAPTVALCMQQHKSISEHIPTAKSRTLLGLDKVDLWTEQAIWDSVLKDIQIVVSTPAVLLDAMTHGFVRIGGLGLVVFDEAHHCTLNHPANKIMKLFYHPALEEHGPDAVPRILGLTASAASNRNDLKTIEANLGSVCTTPQLNRTELLEHTHRPTLLRVLYTPTGLGPQGGARVLEETCQTLDIEEDPYVKKLRRKSPNGKALLEILISRKTYCSDQLKKFAQRAAHIYEQLGSWAAEYFIWESSKQLRQRKKGDLNMELDDDERQYLVELFSRIPAPDLAINSTNPADFPVSPKFEALISFLQSTEEKDFSGLIFVQQRATVAVMSHLLQINPSTKHRFQTGGFIGMSNSTKKKDMLGDLLTVKTQRNTLDDFRAGTKNLIVATDVLEEGIDVSACSVVVCFDKPPSLKSFVQRRGRARRQDSTYAIVLSSEDLDSSLRKWHNVERDMEEAYKEDRRRVEAVRDLERIDEDVHALFRVQSTGAILTADNAMQHLHHFCSTLPREGSIDTKPEFSFESHEYGSLKGKVTLPSCVDPRVRRAEGKSWWKTERAARKEAAFEAYKALYEHGLVNENLLPLTKSRDFTKRDLAHLPAIQDVQGQYDPWVELARAWSECPDRHESSMIIRQGGRKLSMRMIAPTALPVLEPMTLYWDSETTYSVHFEPARQTHLDAENLQSMRASTTLYLNAASTRPSSNKQDFITLFSPDLRLTRLPDWLKKNEGHERAQSVFAASRDPACMGVVRDQNRYGEMLLFKQWVQGPNGLELECVSYPKRRNLLQHPVVQNQTDIQKPRAEDPDAEETESPTYKRIPVASCTIDRLPSDEALIGRFIPVILDRLEALLAAERLRQTLLPTIPFSNLTHIVTAITMPSACAPTNYQRYEFFGDSVLKFSIAVSLYYNNPTWHEGYLTQALHALVHNGRLARAAKERGLDLFILSRVFKPRKWVAPFISDKGASGSGLGGENRKLSTKVLADVVEALIGAAYIDGDGGHKNAQSVIRCFLPESKLDFPLVDTVIHDGDGDGDVDMDTEMDTDTDSRTNTATTTSSTQLGTDTGISPAAVAGPHLINQPPLEAAIGHTFTNPSLLVEALTHPSCQYDALTQSYQRLEFLGDAVLDMLVVDIIRAHHSKLQQGDMTRIKQAVVNGGLLAVWCLEFEFPSGFNEGSSNAPGGAEQGKKKEVEMHLYTYLRHSPSALSIAPSTSPTIKRYATLRHQILHAINTEKVYPWPLLAKLSAEKFFSDIVESILGAISVDSNGDLERCKKFLENLGIVRYVNRILDEGVDVLHPMQKAQIRVQKVAARTGKMKIGGSTGEIDFQAPGKTGTETETNTGPGTSTSTTTTTGVEGVRFDCKTIRVPREPTHDEEAEGEATYTCTIALSAYGLGLNDVTVTGCISREDAEVQAAIAVIDTLRKYENGMGKETVDLDMTIDVDS